MDFANLVNADIVKISAGEYFSMPGKLMDLVTLYLSAKRKKNPDG